MKRVLTAVVLVPLVLLAVFRAPIWLFALLVAVVIVLALHEYLGIADAAGFKPFRLLTYVAALLPIFLLLGYRLYVSFAPSQRLYAAFPSEFPVSRTLSILPLLMPLIFGIPLVFAKELRGGLSASAISAFGVLYIAGSLSLLIVLRANPVQDILIPFAFFSVWAGDIAAYYVGRSMGKHKLAPIVSPNKSWEGAIASVIASVAAAFLVLHFSPQLNQYFAGNRKIISSWQQLLPEGWTGFSAGGVRLSLSDTFLHAVFLGVLTNVAAQFGDLFESALKRGANVKDSGTLLPGHGGVLDRIDALLFAIPVVWYYAQLTGFLRSPMSIFYRFP